MTTRNAILRVSLSYAAENDGVLEQFTAGVVANLYANAAFTTPPVTKVDLEALLTDFHDAMAAMVQGGTAATAEKNNKRDALLAKLKELAFYVEVKAANNLAVLLSSGFQAASTNRAQEPLATPTVVKIVHGQSGELLPTVTAIRNGRGFELEIAEVTGDSSFGPWISRGYYSSSRRMSVTGLQRGTTYAIRVRALGGSTGYSDWCSPAMQMCL